MCVIWMNSQSILKVSENTGKNCLYT
uniref:Uncharacterized protein n=1 Tax=Rhizophora mucronata TaxID=61149 RepID=A0A2P2PFY4_RHIMU